MKYRDRTARRYGAARLGSEYLFVQSARLEERHEHYIVFSVDREDSARQYRRLAVTNRALSPIGYYTTAPLYNWVRNVYGFEPTGRTVQEDDAD